MYVIGHYNPRTEFVIPTLPLAGDDRRRYQTGNPGVAKP